MEQIVKQKYTEVKIVREYTAFEIVFGLILNLSLLGFVGFVTYLIFFAW